MDMFYADLRILCTTCHYFIYCFQITQGGKRKKDEISVESLDFNRKILHTAWHPKDSIIAVAATNNLYIFDNCGAGNSG